MMLTFGLKTMPAFCMIGYQLVRRKTVDAWVMHDKKKRERGAQINNNKTISVTKQIILGILQCRAQDLYCTTHLLYCIDGHTSRRSGSTASSAYEEGQLPERDEQEVSASLAPARKQSDLLAIAR